MEEQKSQYGLVYKDSPPYEVLYTKWLSYKDMLILKQVESMVEIYYNSGQFTYTILRMEREFSSAFSMYRALGEFYEQQGYDKMNHTRIARYEILYEFLCQNVKDKNALPLYRELLTFDLYLRENIKNRPAFAGDYSLKKEDLSRINREILNKNPQLKGYAQKNMRKMAHMEHFSYNVLDDFKKQDLILLFDYQKRNPLNNQATVLKIEEIT